MKKLSAVILTSVILASTSMPTHAESKEMNVERTMPGKNETSNKSTETSWNYHGIKLTVHSEYPLSYADKEKYEQLTVSQGLVKVARFSPKDNMGYGGGGSQEFVPTPDFSFTLFNQQNKIFDNTYSWTSIYAAIGATIVYIAVPASYGAQLAGGVAMANLTTYINNKLGISSFIYSKIRLGTAYNSYWGYYEYIESLVRYSGSSFSTPIEVIYEPTGTKVPDETLALYGLRNP